MSGGFTVLFVCFDSKRGPCVSSTLVFLSRLNGDNFLHPCMTQIAGAAKDSSDAAFFIFMQTSAAVFWAGIWQCTLTNTISYVRGSPQGGSSASRITVT